MLVREWNKSDLGAVLKIETESFPIPLSENQIMREFQNPNAYYFVAEEGGAILGYGGFWCIVDEAQVMNIAVLPDARGKGIGKSILSEMTNEAEKLGLSFMSLEVREGNMAAISLYQKSGFVPVGERKHYYQDNGETAIIMEKKLEEQGYVSHTGN